MTRCYISAETRANKDLQRDLNDLEMRQKKLCTEEMSRASAREEEILKELDFSEVELRYYNEKKVRSTFYLYVYICVYV